jgi:hypothetical protein
MTKGRRERMTRRNRLISVVLGFLFLAPLAWQARAAEEKSGAATQALSAAGGIVEPGGPTAVFQNPAGLVRNPKFAVTAQAGAGDSFANPFLRAGLLGGGASFKLAGGVDQTTESPSSTSLFYGLGISAGSGFSVGLSGRTGISNAGGTGINAGVLYAGSLPFRLGATVMGISSGVNEWGLGIAGKVGPVDLLLDSAYNPGSESVGLKPGIKIGNADAALSLSYGFVEATGTTQLADGFTAGAGFKLGPSTIQLYYNEFATFYAAVTVGL